MEHVPTAQAEADHFGEMNAGTAADHWQLGVSHWGADRLEMARDRSGIKARNGLRVDRDDLVSHRQHLRGN